jgi:hypothetical protein
MGSGVLSSHTMDALGHISDDTNHSAAPHGMKSDSVTASPDERNTDTPAVDKSASEVASNQNSDWVKVTRKRRKKQRVPSYVLLRFPSDHPIHRANMSSGSHSCTDAESDDNSSPEDMIASRTRSKTKAKT